MLDEDEWEDLSRQRGILRVLDDDKLEDCSIILSRNTKQVAIRKAVEYGNITPSRQVSYKISHD